MNNSSDENNVKNMVLASVLTLSPIASWLLSPWLIQIVTGDIDGFVSFCLYLLMNAMAPGVFWLLWKNKYPVIDRVGKSVLNIQLSWLFVWMVFLSIGYAEESLDLDIFKGRHSALYVLAILLIIWIALTLWNAIGVLIKKDSYTIPFVIRFFK